MAKPRTNPVQTPPFILSYANLVEPKAFPAKPGEAPRKAKYGCVAIFPPGSDLSKLQENATEAKKLFFGAQSPRGLRSPFRKCEEMWKEDTNTGKLIPEPGYMAGGTFIALDGGDRVKPDCRDQRMKEVVDASVLYPGCKCHAVIRAAGYDFEGKNKGVKFYLLTLQKIGEGENIAGRVSAADYFKPVEMEADNATTGATTGDGWGKEDEEDY